ncbi:MAG: amidase domain-containing protein [Chloroflexota bacterium]|nr:amidase domain-containing protein [Chloroflexota bacterium]
MKQFIGGSGRGYFLQYFEDLWIGDVLQADWGNDGFWNHGMIVQVKDCSCVAGIYMSYHDTDRYRKPLVEVLADPHFQQLLLRRFVRRVRGAASADAGTPRRALGADHSKTESLAGDAVASSSTRP